MCSYIWSAVLVKLMKDWLSGCWVLVSTKGLFLVVQNIPMFWVQRNLSLYWKREKNPTNLYGLFSDIKLVSQRYCWKVPSLVITCAGNQWVSQHFTQRFHLCSSCWQPSIPSMPDPGHWVAPALAETCSSADVLTLKRKLSFELCFIRTKSCSSVCEALLGDWCKLQCPSASTTSSKTPLAFYRTDGMITFPLDLLSAMSKVSRHPSPHS